jgi:hypothetical protein
VLSILDRDETRPGAGRDLEVAALFASQAALAVQASTAFADAGRVLLSALAEAAANNALLTDSLAAAPSHPRDPDLREFAALLAEFYRAGPAERALGLRLLRDVMSFVNRGGGGRPSPSR